MTPIRIQIKDDATGSIHNFLVDTDNYGVRVTHEATGDQVAFEIFDGVLQALCFDASKDDEEPVNQFAFPKK